MRKLLAAAAAGVGLAVAGAGSAAEPARYTLTPVLEPDGLALEVTLAFAGDRDGRTDITLPDHWSGAVDLDRAVGDIRAEGAEVSRDGARLRLRHGRGATVRLSYRVRQDFDGPAQAGPERPYRPITAPEGFTAVGWTVLARIEGRETEPARFAWGTAPAGWTLASDLDHAEGGDIGPVELLDSVLVGGPGLRVAEQQAAGARVRVAVHGDWRFSPDELAALFARIAGTAAEFWDEPGEPVLVAVTPVSAPQGVRSQFGAGLGDGFALWLTPNLELAELRHILAHEHLHAWLPERLGGVRSGPDEPLDYWFSEGFTEFFTLRLLVRAGLMTPDEHAEALSRILRRYALSPAREWSNARVASAFWDEAAAADQPYQRGLLLALVLDARLRRESGGAADLDDVVLAMRDGRGRAPERLRAAWRRIAGADLRGELDRHIERGEPIELPAGLFGACATVATLGPATDGQDLVVAAAAAAAGAGPRRGARLLQRGGELTATTTAAAVRLQTVTANPGAPPAACAAALGGAPGI